jgi:hypothetical protein
MNMRGCQLKIDVRGNEKILECASCFIVETLEEGFESSWLQKDNTPLVSGNDGWACAIDHRFSVDIIAVIFVYDEDVLVARDTRNKKFSSGVCVYHPGGAVTVSIYESCMSVVLGRRRHIIFEIILRGWLLPAECGRVSRPNVGAYLVEMSLMHGDGLQRVLVDSGGCEARPGWKISVVDGFTLCVKGRRKQAGVVKGNAIGDGVVRQCGVKHRIDGYSYGIGWRREWGCGWVEGIEGPEAVGGVGSGAG